MNESERHFVTLNKMAEKKKTPERDVYEKLQVLSDNRSVFFEEGKSQYLNGYKIASYSYGG